MSVEDRPTTAGRDATFATTWAPVLVFAVAAAFALALCLWYGTALIDGARYYLLNDDYMIIQRYARNIVRGLGPVFNAGERVEGYSDPLILFGIAVPVQLLGGPERLIGLWTWLISAAASGATAVLLARRSDGRVDGPGLLAALVWTTLPHHAFFARSGLSVYEQALLVLVLSKTLRRDGPAFHCALAALPVIHAICLPLFGAFAVARLAARPRWDEARRLAVATLPFAGWIVFRMSYYGHPFPNTYYLKSTGIVAISLGARYLVHGALWLAPLLAAAAFAIATGAGARLRVLALIVAPYVLFIVKVGGDNFDWYRFQVVLVPALLFGLAECVRSTNSRRAAAAFASVVVLQFALAVFGFVRWNGDGIALRSWDAKNVALGIAIRENTAPTTVVAAFGIGQVGYYGDRPLIDMLGKTDEHIARTMPKEYRKVSHQKDDPDYVLARRPDLVTLVYDVRQMNDIAQLKRDRRSLYGYEAELALNARFRREYVPVFSTAGELPLCALRTAPQRPWRAPELQ